MDLILDTFNSLQKNIQISAATSSKTFAEPTTLVQINRSVYEVYKPLGCPSVDLVFFHGLQVEGYENAYIKTWASGDGSEFWLKWMLEDFPDARIFTVSLSFYLKRRDHQRTCMDMYTTAENIVTDLTDCVGQDKRPVVLVGHSLGGLLLKELCVQANLILNLNLHQRGEPENKSVKHFLQNVKGLFLYATPHYGARLTDRSTSLLKGPLFDEITTHNRKAARQNEDFHSLRKKYEWKIYGVAESQEVTLGKFEGLIVSEASARHDVDDFGIAMADHFGVCRPDSKMSPTYHILKRFVTDVLEQDKALHGPNFGFLDKDPEELSTVMVLAHKDVKELKVRESDYESTSTAEKLDSDLEYKKRSDAVEDFITQVKKGAHSGYYVSIPWLSSIDGHDKEAVLLAFRTAGYLAIYQTHTTVFYERMGDDLEASIATKAVVACEDIIRLRKRQRTSRPQYWEYWDKDRNIGKPDGDVVDSDLSIVSSGNAVLSYQLPTKHTSGTDSPSLTLLEKGKMHLTSSNETLQSFKIAVKDTSLSSYSISTNWLDALRSDERKDLDSTLLKAGYSQVYETNTIRHFERTRGHVHNNPSDGDATASAPDRSCIVGDMEMSSSFQGSGYFLLNSLQGFNADNKVSIGNLTNAMQADAQGDEKCLCPPQLLTVSASSSQSPMRPSTFSLRGEDFSKRSIRQLVGDCYVTMSKTPEDCIRSTRVDKEIEIELRTIKFTGTRSQEESISVPMIVDAETSLSCCLTSDSEDKKVRIEFTKIRGGIKMKNHIRDPRTKVIVLRKVLINVDACIKNTEDVGASKEITLGIQELRSFRTGRRVLKSRGPFHENGQILGPGDLVWLALSETDPVGSEPGSITLELQCDVKRRLADDSEEGTDDALGLAFGNSHPVMFEGDVPAGIDSNSFVEFNIRYQLELSYSKPHNVLEATTPQVGGERVRQIVTFDSILEFRTKKFLLK